MKIVFSIQIDARKTARSIRKRGGRGTVSFRNKKAYSRKRKHKQTNSHD